MAVGIVGDEDIQVAVQLSSSLASVETNAYGFVETTLFSHSTTERWVNRTIFTAASAQACARALYTVTQEDKCSPVFE